MKLTEIQMRDPFVFAHQKDRLYYLFGTTDKNAWDGPGTGFDCYTSSDLENWTGPLPAFRPGKHFWATRNFWAPEVHFYKNRFYMLASFKAEGICRGTQILVSDQVSGPYHEHSKGAVTPPDWECLDGTFHMDPDGNPWMVFCHEWLQVGDGAICATRLDPDLKSAPGSPIVLFTASSADWTIEVKMHGIAGKVTDGPFLYRNKLGHLLMLWSSVGKDGYAMGMAASLNGEVTGPWTHPNEPLYRADGGHGMFFTDFSGQLHLTLHRPNNSPNERPHFFRVTEQNGSVVFEK